MEQIKTVGIKEVNKPVPKSGGLNVGHQPDLRFSFVAKKTALSLTAITGLLLVMHIIAYFVFFRFPERLFALNLVKRFGLDREGNIPTLFSALILFLAGGLLYLIYREAKARKQKHAVSHWLVLSFAFIFLGVDEATRIHEFIADLMRALSVRPLPGFLKHAWVIPYVILLGGAGVHYLRFILQLPARTRNQFLVAGAVYVGSALGLEMIEGIVEVSKGEDSLLVLQLQTVEETLEMLSVILFNYALLQYLGNKKLELQLNS